MRGCPTIINTKNDVLNLKDNYPKETLLFLEQIAAVAITWHISKPISGLDQGVQDDTHRILVVKIDGKDESYQEELCLDPACILIRMEYSIEEVDDLIKSLKEVTN